MNSKLALIALSFLAFSCSSNADKSKETDLNQEVATQKDTVQVSSNTYDLLQGKWQHSEDKTNFLIFDKFIRKEMSAGMTEWDEETYAISDHCLNEADKESVAEPEKDLYISCAESDLCWYIALLDADNLELTYMGRGNTLKYTRVK
jgi:hypothetical protein